MRIPTLFITLGAAALVGGGVASGCGDDGGGAASSDATTSSSSGGSCTLTNPVCTAVASDCIAINDNKGQTTFGLRMAQLSITKPEVLKTGFIAKLVADGLRMDLKQCFLNGTGDFTWLLEFDTMTGKLRTGGALPTDDPLKGYCFAKTTVGMFDIAPIEVDAPLTDGAFTADADDLIVPIFLDAGGDPITLPLHKTRLFDAKVSADNNCIGQRNGELDPNNLCLPDEEHPSFLNGGKLSAFITLEEVDQVVVPDVNQSLCVVLSGDATQYGNGATPSLCKRDAAGKIVVQGDWCSTTNAAATPDCNDAFALGAEYAASAVKINGICP